MGSCTTGTLFAANSIALAWSGDSEPDPLAELLTRDVDAKLFPGIATDIVGMDRRRGARLRGGFRGFFPAGQFLFRDRGKSWHHGSGRAGFAHEPVIKPVQKRGAFQLADRWAAGKFRTGGHDRGVKIFCEGFEPCRIVLPGIEQQLGSVRQAPPARGGFEFVLKNPLDEVGRIQPFLFRLEDRVGLPRAGRPIPSFKNISWREIGRCPEVIPRVQSLELVLGNGFFVASAALSHCGKVVPTAADAGRGGRFPNIRPSGTPPDLIFCWSIDRNGSGLLGGGGFFTFLVGHPQTPPRSCDAAKQDFATLSTRGSPEGCPKAACAENKMRQLSKPFLESKKRAEATASTEERSQYQIVLVDTSAAID